VRESVGVEKIKKASGIAFVFLLLFLRTLVVPLFNRGAFSTPWLLRLQTYSPTKKKKNGAHEQSWRTAHVHVLIVMCCLRALEFYGAKEKKKKGRDENGEV
jgi:hypothetical protein